MKRFSIIFLVLLFTFSAFSADVYDKAVTVNNSAGGALIKFVVTAGSDSTGSQHSLPIHIGASNDSDAYGYAYTGTASDANIIFHFSNDLNKWVSVTAASLDAVSSTVKQDTLGVTDSNATRFHEFAYMVIEVDFQSGTTQDDELSLSFFLKADRVGDHVHAYVVEGGSKTNP